jgi:hypothetical protein
MELLAFSLLAAIGIALIFLLAYGAIDIQSFKEMEMAVIGIIGGILAGIGVGIRLATKLDK